MRPKTQFEFWLGVVILWLSMTAVLSAQDKLNIPLKTIMINPDLSVVLEVDKNGLPGTAQYELYYTAEGYQNDPYFNSDVKWRLIETGTYNPATAPVLLPVNDPSKLLNSPSESQPTISCFYVLAAYSWDTDNDGLPDIINDQDGDGLSDAYELLVTKTSPYLKDTDGNGLDDNLEDFDYDGLTNEQEYFFKTDPYNEDTDGDGLSDGVETNTGIYSGSTNTGTNPLSYDTDGDGLHDNQEIIDIQFDGFETGDFSAMEWSHSGDKQWVVSTDTPYAGIYSARVPANLDHDESSVLELHFSITSEHVFSFFYKCSTQEESDNLSIVINNEVKKTVSGNIDWTQFIQVLPAGTYHVRLIYQKDDENDSGDDTVWIDNVMLLSGTNPNIADMDGDGLLDGEEIKAGTSPHMVDTDGDGISDYDEIKSYKTNPRMNDTDLDGLNDWYEVNFGLDPNNPDTDGDQIPDGWESQWGLNPNVPDSMLDSDGDGRLTNYEEFILNSDPFDANDPHVVYVDPNGDQSYGNGTIGNPYGSILQAIENYYFDYSSSSGAYNNKAAIFVLNNGGGVKVYNLSNDLYIAGLGLNSLFIDQDFFYYQFFGSTGTNDVFRFAIYATSPDKVTIKAKPGNPVFKIWYGDSDYYGYKGYNNSIVDNATARILIKNVTIVDATSALDVNYSSPVFVNCVIKNNKGFSGAAVNVNYSNPEIINCLLTGNTALRGAGIFITGASEPAIVHCTIAGNIAQEGIGIYLDGTTANPIIINSIIWEESGDDIANITSSMISYCNIEDGDYNGINGNISLNPQFGSPQFGNYHILYNSPCIGAGDAVGMFTRDIHNEIRPSNSTCDIGYDEFVDANSNNLPDFWENMYGGGPFTASADNDLDGATNAQEAAYLSNPLNADTDGDGANDGLEINTYHTNPLTNIDTDGDGLMDIAEASGNGVGKPTDPYKTDTDGDGINDYWEIFYNLNPNNPADASLDSDGDGITNYEEIFLGSNPNNYNSPDRTYDMIYVNQATGYYSYSGPPYPDGSIDYPYASLQEAMDKVPWFFGGYSSPKVFIVANGTYDINADNYLYDFELNSIIADQAWFKNEPSYNDVYRCIIMGSSPENVTIVAKSGFPAIQILYGSDPACGDPPVIVKNIKFTGGTRGIEIQYSKNVLISNCIITDNFTSFGAGVYVDISTINIFNTEISGNVATNAGAGLYLLNSNLTMIGGSVKNNTNVYEGGSGLLGQGGGLYLSGSSPLLHKVVMHNVSVEDNVTFAQGAGLYAEFITLELDNDTFSGNHVSVQNSGAVNGDGAGMYLKSLKCTIKDTVITDNKSEKSGGGLYAKDGRYYSSPEDTYGTYVPILCVIESSEISDNLATTTGGGLCLSNSRTVLYDTVVSGNETIASFGAGAAIDNGTFIMEECDFASNIAETAGGGIHSNNAILDISNSSIRNNLLFSSAGYGGGLLIKGTKSATVSSSTISENHAVTGGGIYLDGSDPIISDIILEENTAYKAAGLYLHDSRPTIIQSTIKGNVAESHGGGVITYSSIAQSGLPNRPSNLTMQNSIIKNNKANEGAGLVFESFTVGNIRYSIIDSNTSISRSEGGIWLKAPQYGYPINVRNCVLVGNTGDLSGNFIQGSASTVRYNCIESTGYPADAGNISVTPQFVSPMNDNYHLRATSPLRKMGTAYDTAGTDIDGEVRPFISNPLADYPAYFERPLENASDIGLDQFIDTDNDGMPDWWESYYAVDFDNDGDWDNDDVINIEEYNYGTSPVNPDTDNDGIPDFAEIFVYNTNPCKDDDTDGDGLLDREEIYNPVYNLYGYGTDPANPDTDGDGMDDKYEIDNNLNPLQVDALLDSDSDNLSNYEEFLVGTDPNDDSEPVTVYASSYPTIQAAINAATGPTIIILEDDTTYVESLILKNDIFIIAGDPLSTVITSNAMGPVITAIDVQRCLLKNINIKKGIYGVYAKNSSINIINCRIKNNLDSGVYMLNSNAESRIINCKIYNNNAIHGGGIYCSDASLTVVNTDIYNNTAQHGGGLNVVLASAETSFTIANSNIVSNSAFNGGGIARGGSKPINIENCNIIDNTDDLYNVSAVEIFNSNISDGDFLGTNNNISQDPRFGAPQFGRFHLLGTSPSIDAGTTKIYFALDPDNELRKTGVAIDIGSDEFVDTDGDDMGDAWELKYAANLTILDPEDDDDGDGIINIVEYAYYTDPTLADTDNDGLTDAQEINGILYQSQTIYTDPIMADTDEDGISDGDEINIYGTNPLLADTDGDGINDGWEILFGLNPLVHDSDDDLDADGLTNAEEFELGTAPNDDTDPIQIYVDNTGAYPGSYTSITAAVQAVPGPVIINILPGVYAESVSLTAANEKTVIIGTSPSEVIISGGYTSPAISCTNITYLIIKNVTLRNSMYGLYSQNSSPRLINCISTGNAGADEGSGVYSKYGSLELIDSTISHNFTKRNGAGLFAYYTKLTITDSIITNNTITDESITKGGGIYVYGSEAIITGSTISENHCTKAGGGIYVDTGANLQIIRSVISNNFSGSHGGGLYSFEPYGLLLDGCYVVENISQAVGGGIYLMNSSPSIFHTTFYNNRAYEKADGIFSSPNSAVNLKNSILWNFNDDFDGIQSSQIAHCNIKDGSFAGSNGNISIDPLFVNSAKGNYHILPDSPCADAGISIPTAATMDSDGELRSYNGVPDIGADEIIDSDNDGIADYLELLYAVNLTVLGNNDADFDGDTVTDLQEYIQGSNPTASDTDGDGINDSDELLVYYTDPNSVDTDGDGINDYDEVFTYFTDPLNIDTDGDGIDDYYESITSGLSPTDPSDAQLDFDGDGLTNLEEYYLGSNINLNTSPVTINVTTASDLQNVIDTASVPAKIVMAAGTYSSLIQSNYYSILLKSGIALYANPADTVIITSYGAQPVVTADSVNGAVIKNIKVSNGQGGITVNRSSKILLNNCTVENNVQGGSGIKALSSSLMIYNSKIRKNTATMSGAGIYAFNTLVSIKNSVIEDNVSKSALAGGIAVFNYNTSNHYVWNVIEGCKISGNIVSQGDGGGVAVVGAPLKIFNTEILNNTGINGGGICSRNSRLIVSHSIIKNNIANLTGGGFMLSRGNDILVDHSIILDNISYKSIAGGINISAYSEGTIRNSVICNEFDDISEVSSAVVIRNNVIRDGTYKNVNGNIDDDPEFIDPAKGNYRLKNTSPLINAGTADTLLYRDVDGETSMHGGASDIGIDEFVDTDSDGMADAWEIFYTGGLTTVDDTSDDTDSDGLTDGEEYNLYTNPTSGDTDGDGLSDIDEVNIYGTNPCYADTDGDGINDSDEINIHGTNPLLTDTDGDGIDDYYEVSKAFLSPTNPADASLDQDSDGLTNYEEYYLGSDPNSFSSPSRITVSGTIQTAINQTASPKIVLIGSGSFSEALSIANKQGVVLWAQSPALTTLSAPHGNTCLNITNSQKVIIKNIKISGASNSAITINNSSIMIKNCVLDNNTSFNNGGAVLSSASTIECYDTIISNNLVNYLGGGFYLDMSNLSIRGCEFQKNQYYNIYALNSSVFVSDTQMYNQFLFNGSTYTYYRQAVYGKYSQITIKDSSLYDILSSAKGGAVYASESRLDASNITVYGVAAKDHGGAIYLYNSLADIVNAVLYNNKSDKNGGAFMIDDGSRANIYHSVIYNNTAAYGGGIYNIGSPASRIINCVVWGNKDDLYNVPVTVLHNSNIGDADHVGVNGNICQDPVFRKASKSDFHLLHNSPCRNAGILISGLNVSDIDGDTRPFGALPDIGIDEFVDTDNDGLPDWWETLMGGDIVAGSDLDNDGLTALDEYAHLTNPILSDTDGDGLSDGEEVLLYDTDPVLNADKDGDGLTDAQEILVYMTDPANPDTDGDLISDKWEVDHGLNPLLASDALNDGDGDSITNREEYFIGSEPDNSDSPIKVYVDINAAQGGNGSQGSPYNSIQTAISNNTSAQVPVVLMLAAGTYKENLYLYDRISIVGESPETTILESPFNSVSTLYYPQRNKAGMLIKNITFHKGLRAIDADDTNLMIINCVFNGNSGNPTYGGAIQFNKSNSLLINVVIRNSSCSVNGGGIYANNSNPKLIDCTIENNSATVQGGGIYIENATDSLLKGCVLRNNTAQIGAGALFQRSSVIVRNSQFKQNNATSEGAGLYLYSGSPSIYNTIFNMNTTNGRGGAIYGAYCNSTVENCVLYGNRAGTSGQNQGNGIYKYNGYILVKNTILWNNGQELGGFDSSTVFNCDIKDGSYNGVNGNISVDPKFVNVELGDFHLLTDSPCIDAGTAQAIELLDIDGEARPSNGFVDIGIDEVIDDDDDGLPNYWENRYGGNFDPLADDDSDNLTNFQEYLYQTNPLLTDTDNDGLRDDEELLVYFTDPNNPDTDGDGLSDGDEILVYLSDPFISDTDNDGMIDGWEAQYGLNPVVNDAYANLDNDFLTNYEEYVLGSNPNDNTSPLSIYVDIDYATGGDGSQGAPFNTIQDAIDIIPVNGSAVVVIAGGIYNENLNLSPAGAVALYAGPEDKVVLRAHPYDYAITCKNRDAILIVKNIFIEYGKGGIFCSNAPMIVVNSHIRRNFGSGIVLDTNNKMVKIINSSITHNKAKSGGGLWCYESSPEIINSVISYNDAIEGGGIWASSSYSARDSAPKIFHSIIMNNTATTGGGIYVGVYDLALRVRNSVIWGNGKDLFGGTSAMLRYCSIQDGSFVSGSYNNISVAPNFGAPQFGRYHLLADSGLINAGSEDVKLATDKDGEIRPYNTNCDIGIDEYIDLDLDGLSDHWESFYNGDFDPSVDDDNDGIINSIEYAYFSDPTSTDTDNDGISDADEILVYFTDPTRMDTDDDGLSDSMEISLTSDPLNPDTDGDGMPDGWEFAYGLNILSADDKNLDADNDGLTNYEEYFLGSIPTDPNSPEFVYIDDSASDGGNGSQATPYNTIAEALQNAQPPYVFHISGTFSVNITLNESFVFVGDNATITGKLTNQPVMTINGVGIGVLKNITLTGGRSVISIDSSTVQITGCTIKNSATNATNGGGIGIFGSEVNIKDTEISNCGASLYGGGLFIGANDLSISSTVNLDNVLIKANRSSYDGGGLMADSKAVVTILNSKIYDNTAVHYGGGIGLKSNSNVKMINTVLALNHANTSGGGVFCQGAKPEILNCVLYKNTRTSGSGSTLYYISTSLGFVRNIIIWSDDTYGEQQDISGVAAGMITYSNIEDSIGEEYNNMSVYPEFADPDSYNFHLLPSSPLIDKGTPEAEYPKDVDGQTRPRGIAVDMGIDEYYPQQ